MINNGDRLQLCAQAMCLEEMLMCPPLEQGCLYYGETRRREYVDLTNELRGIVREMFAEMHKHFERRYTPRVKPNKNCNSCSLRDICVPKLPGERSVRTYIADVINKVGDV
jgi:CRISPR-associated exonuclease Cas4